MKDKLSAFAREHLAPGDHVIVAVSGGQDSMALLHGLWTLSTELEITVSAAHYNHMLRGAESDRDAAFVRSFCDDNGIQFFYGNGDVTKYAAAHGLGIEEAARSLRYGFLESLSDHAKIATAHTAEDNLETVLMYLIRGSGLHGLTGIPPVRGQILRPMLQVTHSEIAAYLKEHQIPHIEDSTNRDDDCLRNRIRHQVLPVLERENPQAAQHVAKLCETLRGEDAYMDAQARTALSELCQGPRMDCTGFSQLPAPLQYRVMGQFLASVPQLQRVHLEAALSLAHRTASSGSMDLPGGWRLRRIYDMLELSASKNTTAPLPVTLIPGQSVRFGPWLVTCKKSAFMQSQETGTFLLCGESLAWPLILRPRQSGDRIRLPGGSKKLSDLMIDKKIPVHLRDSLPVVCIGDEIAAVLPLTVAQAFRPRAGMDVIQLSATRMED